MQNQRSPKAFAPCELSQPQILRAMQTCTAQKPNGSCLLNPIRLKPGGEGMRTVEILVGSGIEMRERAYIRPLRRPALDLARFGIGGQECPPHTRCANANRFCCGLSSNDEEKPAGMPLAFSAEESIH